MQIRLVRIFRVFKFGRYSLGLQMFVGCLKASTQPLGILAVIVVIASTVFGALINICEVPPQSLHTEPAPLLLRRDPPAAPPTAPPAAPPVAPPTVLALGGRPRRVRWGMRKTC